MREGYVDPSKWYIRIGIVDYAVDKAVYDFLWKLMQERDDAWRRIERLKGELAEKDA